MTNDSRSHRTDLDRERLIRAVSRDGPVESARRLEKMRREQLLRMQARGRRIENPRPFERRIHATRGNR